jgi:hypothetical protein
VISFEESWDGIYIDFEGARDAPSLLAVLFFDEEEDEVVYTQYILESDLHPARWTSIFLQHGRTR